MHYLLIRGGSYRGLSFDERERVRECLRIRLEAHGIRFVEYPWVWDEEDQCLLLAGSYERPEEAHWWAKALEGAGFELCMRTSLPGEPPGSPGDIPPERPRSGRDRRIS